MTGLRPLLAQITIYLTLIILTTCGKDSSTKPTAPTPPPQPPPVTTRIDITPSSPSLNTIGQAVQLTAKVYDQNNSLMIGASVTWSSGTPSVATVSRQGLVTAVGNGTASITARSGGVMASVTVTVMVPQMPASIVIDPSVPSWLESIGATVQLAATVLDQGGQPVSDAAISWSSGTPSVATVSRQGLVTAVGYGTASITARSGGVMARVTVTVKDTSRDREVLVSFYHSTNGPEWTNSMNWLSETPFNTWYGVGTDSKGEVTSLDLNENNLKGPIPSVLGQLQNLTSLWLSRNDLTDNIPPELGQLINLNTLGLSGNIGLAGPLPTSLLDLNLTTFWISNTHLCVPYTAEFHAWHSGISNKSANAFCIDQERDALIALHEATDGPNWKDDANWTSFGPLSTWFGVTVDTAGKVTALNLPDNNMDGPLLSILGDLVHLRVLNLSGNENLSGPLFRAITALDLEHLDLGGTRLCAPPLPVFQEWLDGIPVREVSYCTEARQDYYALETLYRATDGANWTDNTNWLSEAPLSTWHGVETNANGEVTFLDMYENNLKGSVPVEIGELRNLSHLLILNNQLTGHIPPEMGQLQNLTTLVLHGNQLTGHIPPEMGQLQNLTTLELSRNQLTGHIPPEMGQLQNLTRLELYRNQLTGHIPPEIGQLQNLTTLVVYDNQLTGHIPPEMGQLQNLTRLELYRNQLAGHIPPEIGQLQNLTRLELYDNQLTGHIPPEIGQLQNLTRLELYRNQLTGHIPPEIGQLQKLSRLDLGNNKLTGHIPSELGQLIHLNLLIVRSNIGLTGSLPTSFLDLNLDIFLFNNTNLCVPITAEFREWFSGISDNSGVTICIDREKDVLIALHEATDGPNWTEDANWTSSDPLSTWYGVSVDADGKVTALNLPDNNMAGPLPPVLVDLVHLKVLNFSDNENMSGPIPRAITGLALERLDLRRTRLCAPPRLVFQEWLDGIPVREVSYCTEARQDYYALDALYSATDGANWTYNDNWRSEAALSTWYGVGINSNGKVASLDLRENNLKGSIPVEIGELQDLSKLELGDNKLTGQIPPELGQLQNLTSLRLGVNKLTGQIPPELGQLQNLTILEFLDNQLTGHIPREIGQLQNLTVLELSYNQLTGHIPPELGQLQNLKWLDFFNNQLTGQVPRELGQLQNLTSLWLDRNQLTGHIPRELGQLQNLTSFRLDRNQLTGQVPRELGQLQNLTSLWLGRNQLTGHIPRELGGLDSLTEMYLSDNQLSGSIPPEIGSLQNLTSLDLHRNLLSGRIPDELGRMSSLTDLRLSYNQLKGNIPSTLGDLPQLNSLILTNNASMSGALPRKLHSLNFDNLLLGGTGLCAPGDAAFQVWLREIPNSRVAICDFNIGQSAAYLTQATQSLKYPVPLVAGEDALLRVFVTSDVDGDVPMPSMRATFYRSDVEVYALDIAGSETPIPRLVDEGDLSTSANALIPGSALTPGLEMVIDIDPDGVANPTLGTPERLPSKGRIAVNVRELPAFDLTVVPFLWTEFPDRSFLAEVQRLTADSDMFRLTRDILPVRELDLTVREPLWTSDEPVARNLELIDRQVRMVRAMDGASGYYMGFLTNRGGAAPIAGYTSVSSLDADVIAHELGHNLTLAHAPCGSAPGPDSDFPYPDGSIGAWGYDMLEGELVSPVTPDLMSYCGPPDWISDFHFRKALGYRISQAQEIPMTAAFATSARNLLLWGGVNESGELVLEPTFVVDAPPSLPDLDGPYVITGDSEDGDVLFTLPFGMAEVGDANGMAFAFILPVRSDWSGRLDRIILSGPEGIAILADDDEDGEDDPSAALLLESATGKLRGILRNWPEPYTTVQSGRRILPEPGLEVVISRGIPEQIDW